MCRTEVNIKLAEHTVNKRITTKSLNGSHNFKRKKTEERWTKLGLNSGSLTNELALYPKELNIESRGLQDEGARDTGDNIMSLAQAPGPCPSCFYPHDLITTCKHTFLELVRCIKSGYFHIVSAIRASIQLLEGAGMYVIGERVLLELAL